MSIDKEKTFCLHSAGPVLILSNGPLVAAAVLCSRCRAASMTGLQRYKAADKSNRNAPALIDSRSQNSPFAWYLSGFYVMTWAQRSSEETAAGVTAQRRTEKKQSRGGEAVSDEGPYQAPWQLIHAGIRCLTNEL